MTKWKIVPAEPDDSTLSAMHEKMYDVRGMKWHDGMSAVYIAGVNAAPQPPKLSDERIREIWIEHGLDDEDVEGFARAIEREILGGWHE